jgi:hypothetical protein
MNELLQLQDQIRTNTAAIRRLETELVQTPDSFVVQANLRSLRKLQDSLVQEVHDVAREVGVNVCSYRMLENQPNSSCPL